MIILGIISCKKILTFSYRSQLLWLVLSFAFAPPCLAQSAWVNRAALEVVGLKVVGAKRSDEHWLRRYLALSFPAKMNEDEFQFIRRKLLTTEVFTQVFVYVESAGPPFAPDAVLLVVEVQEKWTTIPVVRGAYGGGTPMAVFGVYDTHAFGKLWTLGAEGRRYGTEPLSGVLWARAPRFLEGNHVRSFELWREHRLRTFFDRDDEPIGTIKGSYSMLRIMALEPFKNDFAFSKPAWRYGFDLRFRHESGAQYLVDDDASSQDVPRGIYLGTEQQDQAGLYLRIELDRMQVAGMEAAGPRLTLLAGPTYEGSSIWKHRIEAEVFHFEMWRGLKTNFASHLFSGQVTSDSVESLYFLGGLDSIRGIPDGASYGSCATYMNLELRQIFLRSSYAWLQAVEFVDVGNAAAAWRDVFSDLRASSGIGIRLSIPQVNRLVFRLDYAWSLDRPGTQGISLGMNQFFQPHRPL